MREVINSLFLRFAGVLLFALGAAKLVSGAGTAQILQKPDPLFDLQYRYVFLFVGMLEIAVALFCLIKRQKSLLKLGLIAWLASSFAVYRIALLFMHNPKPCPCLGSLAGALHLSNDMAANLMKVILGYLLIGSYGLLLWHYGSRRTQVEPAQIIPASSG
jgi:uncharacterized membrane protein